MMPQRHRFVKGLAAGLRQHCGVGAGDHLLLAVSGGCDSVALARGLALIAPCRPWRLRLALAHVQHHLRPEPQAEADAAFTADLARTLGLPFLRADLPPRPAGNAPGNTEAWARHARYQALAEMARAWGAGYVVTAHHADDQLETILMRMLRGASLTGLAGMRWRRTLSQGPASGGPLRLIRPMLGMDRALAQDFLRALGQPWREDATNQDASRLRARLRRDVLPVLRHLRPDLPQRTVHLGQTLAQAARLVRDQVSAAGGQVTMHDGQAALDRRRARLLPGLVLGGLLRQLLRQAGVPADSVSQRSVLPLLRAVRDTTGGRRVFRFAGGVVATVTRQDLRVRRG